MNEELKDGVQYHGRFESTANLVLAVVFGAFALFLNFSGLDDFLLGGNLSPLLWTILVCDLPMGFFAWRYFMTKNGVVFDFKVGFVEFFPSGCLTKKRCKISFDDIKTVKFPKSVFMRMDDWRKEDKSETGDKEMAVVLVVLVKEFFALFGYGRGDDLILKGSFGEVRFSPSSYKIPKRDLISIFEATGARVVDEAGLGEND